MSFISWYIIVSYFSSGR